MIVGFKPVYKVAYPQFLRETKQFNYSEKRFSTVLKKSDPVSRFNAFKNSWNNTKFLKSNTVKGKEGRKLNLAERNQLSKPEPLFHKYHPKGQI